MALDIAAITQQLTSRPGPNRLADALLRRELTLRPHPVWQLPEHLTWIEDPFQDSNWRHQLHMLRWLAPLVQAGRAGDLAAARLCAHYITDWAEKNPPGTSRTEAAWADMVDGIRATHIVLAVPMMAEHSPEVLPAVAATVADHGRWIAQEEHLGHSNHALHQHEGLLLCGIALGEKSWIELATERIGELLRSQWDTEGINAEGAIAYHRNNYVWWQRLLARVRTAGLELPEGAQVLEATPVALAHATRPDGVLVPIGDTDDASATGIDHPACTYVTTQGSEGEPPRELFKVYRDGYAFGRSGWGEFERDMAEETFFSMPFGRYKIHGHADGGSLTFSSAGVNWVTDPGKYSYTHSDPLRQHVVFHDSHSLLYLADQPRHRNAAVPLTDHRESEAHWEITVSDQGYSRAEITRRVIYSKSGEYLLVLDTVRSERSVVGVQRWQLGEAVEAAPQRNVVTLSSGSRRAALYPSGTKAEISVLRSAGPDQLQGRIATAWKRSVAAPVVEMKKEGTSFRFVTVLSAGQKVEPSFQTVKGLPPGVLALFVDNGFSRETIVVEGQNVRILPGLASMDQVSTALALAPTPQAPRADRGHGQPAPPRREPLSVDEHTEMLQALTRARTEARHAERSKRDAMAHTLEEASGPLVRGQEFDLGLEACLSDLRGGSSAPSTSLSTTRAPLVNWDADESWRPTFYDVPVRTHYGRWDPAARLDDAALHTLEYGPLVLPALAEHHPGKILTVLFHGAINRTRSRLPIFQRMALQRTLAAGPILGFSDATLDLDPQMRLGWYLGAGPWDLTHAMVEVIRGTANAWGVEHVVLQGNSGGGFAAMQVAAQMPEAHTVVFNPQTDIRRYSTAHALRAFEAVFGRRAEPSAASQLERVSVAHRCRATGSLGQSLTYVSNTGDNIHVTKHETPLLEDLARSQVSTEVKRVQLHLGDGHKPIDNESYAEIMTSLYASL